MRRSTTYLLALTLSLCLAACGLRGPLYLPKEETASAEQKAGTSRVKEDGTGENKKKDELSP